MEEKKEEKVEEKKENLEYLSFQHSLGASSPYSSDLRRCILRKILDGKMTVSDASKIPGAPSKRTIHRWLKNERESAAKGELMKRRIVPKREEKPQEKPQFSPLPKNPVTSPFHHPVPQISTNIAGDTSEFSSLYGYHSEDSVDTWLTEEEKNLPPFQKPKKILSTSTFFFLTRQPRQIQRPSPSMIEPCPLTVTLLSESMKIQLKEAAIVAHVVDSSENPIENTTDEHIQFINMSNNFTAHFSLPVPNVRTSNESFHIMFQISYIIQNPHQEILRQQTLLSESFQIDYKSSKASDQWINLAKPPYRHHPSMDLNYPLEEQEERPILLMTETLEEFVKRKNLKIKTLQTKFEISSFPIENPLIKQKNFSKIEEKSPFDKDLPMGNTSFPTQNNYPSIAAKDSSPIHNISFNKNSSIENPPLQTKIYKYSDPIEIETKGSNEMKDSLQDEVNHKINEDMEIFSLKEETNLQKRKEPPQSEEEKSKKSRQM